MKALVVDKSSTMRSILHRILSMREFEVTEAGSVLTALDLMQRTGSPDIALVQWSGNDMGTLELLSRLRNELSHRTRIILLAEAELGARELKQVLMAGADDYLVKPFTSLQIDKKLEQAGLTLQWSRSVDHGEISCR